MPWEGICACYWPFWFSTRVTQCDYIMLTYSYAQIIFDTTSPLEEFFNCRMASQKKLKTCQKQLMNIKSMSKSKFLSLPCSLFDCCVCVCSKSNLIKSIRSHRRVRRVWEHFWHKFTRFFGIKFINEGEVENCWVFHAHFVYCSCTDDHFLLPSHHHLAFIVSHLLALIIPVTYWPSERILPILPSHQQITKIDSN